jgi:NitT/TauT family transport system permease protein
MTSVAATARPPAARGARRHPWKILRQLGWTVASVGLFAAIWELLWLIGWADPKLLPPPHVFLGDIPEQAKFFNTVNWQMGVAADAGPSRRLRC